jgi:hypothetical protein
VTGDGGVYYATLCGAREGWPRPSSPGNAAIPRAIEPSARGIAGTTMAAIPLDEFIGRLEGGERRREKTTRA